MNARPFTTLVTKEFLEAVRSRWLLGFAAIFTLMALGIALIGSLGSSMGGPAGFGRTAATLVNVVLLIVPLMGLSAGALSLAGEREKGTLSFLLSLPLRPSHIFWAKWLGLGAAITVSLSAGFGFAGLGLAWKSGLRDAGLYLGAYAVTLLLAFTSLSLGLLISALSRRTAQAVGLTLMVWLGLVFVGDLGLLGTSLALRLRPEWLLAAAAFNPLNVYRVLAIDILGAHLEMLGPAGHCAQDFLGKALRPAGLAILLFWIAAAAGAAFFIYRRDPLKESSR